MIYYTGDIHGSPFGLSESCKRIGMTANDTLIILGDVGANYYGNRKDQLVKSVLNDMLPAVLCIHGNHEMRPGSIGSYRQKIWNGGVVWYEEAFPNVLFAKDGEIFVLEGLSHIAIGGAYSVDKFFRIEQGYPWWSDEQPSPEIKKYVENQLQLHPVDIVLSHTCPFHYEPTEMFLPMIDQSTVDASTEHWLDKIEAKTPYKAWFCGHWHINKRIDKIHFLFHGIESSDQFMHTEKRQSKDSA